MTEITFRLSTALAFTLASTACNGDPVPGTAAVRDSAGITIVEKGPRSDADLLITDATLFDSRTGIATAGMK